MNIEITFVKEDVEKAAKYGDIHNCLLATALKRNGFKKVSVGGSIFSINNGVDRHIYRIPRALDIQLGSKYKKLIGQTFVFHNEIII